MEQGAGRAHAEFAALADILAASDGPGPVWTRTSADLNVNVPSFPVGAGVPAHLNNEVDVLVVALEGDGELAVDGVDRRLAPGDVCLIPKGCERSIRAVGGRFVYLTCHRRRGGLMPA